MFHQDLNNELTEPFRLGQQAPTQPVPQTYQSTHQQTLPPVPNRPPSRGPRTGAIIALTIVLLLVFGVGLFAGWQFGTNGAFARSASV
ncbi:MAG: hypothetical protein JOZ18_18815, partial [Chloroflexi bacterium]|nr:hypothetical protein [Chloroflexota bacterium]